MGARGAPAASPARVSEAGCTSPMAASFVSTRQPSSRRTTLQPATTTSSESTRLARRDRRHATALDRHLADAEALARAGPTHRRALQPGRARNRQGAPQVGSCQTAKDGSDKSGMGVPRSIKTRNKIHACMALRWNETKEKTVLRIRLGRDQGRSRCLVALA